MTDRAARTTCVRRTLHQHVEQQLTALCGELGLADAAVDSVRLVRRMIGGEGARLVTDPVHWASFVADDHTPVEFSLAFSPDAPPTLRVLVERLAPEATVAGNTRSAVRLTRWLAERYRLPLDRFDAVAELLLTDQPQGIFSLWHAVGLYPDGKHDFKVYFNPAARGPTAASALTAQVLDRLNLPTAYRTVAAHGVRPYARSDRFTFFSLDLRHRLDPRAKVYVAHHRARVEDLARAAPAFSGGTAGEVRDFCRLVCGVEDVFTRRPPISCYAFVGDDGDTPRGYTLYLPIRDHVTDDEAARTRLIPLLDWYGYDPDVLDRALRAVASRRLDAGAGLISYVALRMGQRPGLTVYLSSEAYRTGPTTNGSWYGALPDQGGGTDPGHHPGRT